MKSSGEKDNISKAINEKKVDREEYQKYPDEPTVIVNPCDEGIPKEQKIKIDNTYDFGSYVAVARFYGAAKMVEGKNDRVGYQIIVQFSPNYDPNSARYTHTDDYVMLEGNDIQLALDDMEQRIKKDLIPQVAEMLQQELRIRISAAKNKAAISGTGINSNDIELPWFLHENDGTVLSMGSGSGLMDKVRFWGKKIIGKK